MGPLILFNQYLVLSFGLGQFYHGIRNIKLCILNTNTVQYEILCVFINGISCIRASGKNTGIFECLRKVFTVSLILLGQFYNIVSFLKLEAVINRHYSRPTD